MRKLRTLFYGITHEHAAGKLKTLRSLSETYEIVAVVDDRDSSAPYFVNVPADVEGLRVIAEKEAAALKDIDVVFVETSNRRLMDVAEGFVKRGIPLHCDKPCGESFETYRRLVDACRARHLPFQIGYMYRGNPAVNWIWKFVGEGGIGTVRFIEADMNHNYQDVGYAEYISSFQGGILYNLGCHLVDMVLPMVSGSFVSSEHSVCPAPGDPHWAKTAAIAWLRFVGTDVLLRTSSHMGAGNVARRLRVDGTEGTVDLCPIERFDGKELRLTLSRAGVPQREIVFEPQTDRYAGQLRQLAEVIGGQRPSDQDYDRDLRTHEVTLKMCGM